MREGKNLFSAVQLLMVLALFTLSVALISFHYSHELRIQICEWITDSHHQIATIGYSLFGFACLLALGLWTMQREQFIRISMKRRHVLVEKKLVEQSILQFWKQRFPMEKQPIEVFFARHKIEVVSELPKHGDLEKNLEEIEYQLGEMLYTKFGYDREFFVSLSIKESTF